MHFLLYHIQIYKKRNRLTETTRPWMETRVFTGLVFAFLIGIVTAGGGLAINSALSSSSCPTSKFFCYDYWLWWLCFEDVIHKNYWVSLLQSCFLCPVIHDALDGSSAVSNSDDFLLLLFSSINLIMHSSNNSCFQGQCVGLIAFGIFQLCYVKHLKRSKNNL